MALLFEHLEKVFANFEKAHFKLKELDASDELYDLIRSALIQTFEYTWDAFIKAVVRCLVEDVANASHVEGMSYKEQMVEALKKGYISDVELWLNFRKLRNKTSHNYSETHAINVDEASDAFYAEVKSRIAIMKSRHEDLTL
jgi:nucleotidyltransferase substrate binding protein (TIGR01987 family)